MSKPKKKALPQLSKRLLEILVCPVSGGSLAYDAEKSLLFCAESGLAYPVRDGIPVMLVEEAKHVTAKKNKTSPKASS